jgi:hypothetical protein
MNLLARCLREASRGRRRSDVQQNRRANARAATRGFRERRGPESRPPTGLHRKVLILWIGWLGKGLMPQAAPRGPTWDSLGYLFLLTMILIRTYD